MHTVLRRASRNFLWRHPWQLALTILGIALGVAVVVSIDLAMESSLNAFDRAGKVFSGSATYRIIAADGGVDEQLYRQLRVRLGIQNIAPVVNGSIQLAQRPEENFNLIGIDPFIEQSLQSIWQIRQNQNTGAATFSRLVTQPGTALLGAQTALRLHLKVGDDLMLNTGNGAQRLTIIGLLAPTDALAEQVLARLIITDIASAQETLGLFGRLSSIEVSTDNNETEILAKIRRILPGGALLTATDSQSQAMREMTRAFATDLQALGLLSLLVGMFLIYNTMTFLVMQRRSLIGSLRAIGVTRRQIFKLICGEALLLALIGTMLGIALGIALGQGLLHLVARTLNSIYFRIDAASLWVEPLPLLKGAVLGITATMLAVLPPAWEATRFPPAVVLVRSQLESSIRRLIKSATAAGCLCIGGAAAVTAFSGKSIALGLASVFVLLFGFALLTPAVTLVSMRLLERLCGRFFGVLGRLPARMVAAEISRTGIAAAALMIAVAATMGMDLMIGSFRHTVADWLQATLRADLYVALPGAKQTLGAAEKDQRLKAQLENLAGVQLLSSVLHTRIAAGKGFIKASVYELNDKSKLGFIFKHRTNADLWDRFQQQQTVFVTEPYAYHHGITIGSKILLHTGQGPQPFEVIGIYADYSGDQGHLAMSRQNYRRFWADAGYSGIGVYAQPGADLQQLQNSIAKLLSNQQSVKSEQALYQASMQMFEETFAVTETLRWLSAAIAFIGIFSALTALQFERTRQLGILRALGVTPRQITLLITGETALMGLAAGVFAVPVGFGVAHVLIFSVYRRSFGWSLAFQFDAGVIYQGLALALIAAVLAGIFPALAMAKTKPAEALRSE